MKLRRYAFTTRRKAALRKAQLVSAQRRRGRKLSPKTRKAIRNTSIVAGTAAVFGGTAYASKKVGRYRQIKKIDKLVNSRWGVKGSEINGLKVPDLNRNSNPVATYINEEIEIKRRRLLKVLAPTIPQSPIPNDIDEEIFEKSSYKLRRNKKTGLWFKGPHTSDEIKRRKRNRYSNYSGADNWNRPISYSEAFRRMRTYQDNMRGRGIRINEAHMNNVLNRYRQMRGNEY